MQKPGGKELPLELLVKGSIRNLIKESQPLITAPDAAVNINSCSRPPQGKFLTEEPAANNEEREKNLPVPAPEEKKPSAPLVSEIFSSSENSCKKIKNELKELVYKRISLRTQNQEHYDGILVEVGSDFVNIVSFQLCVLTIPLSGIVSFYIHNP